MGLPLEKRCTTIQNDDDPDNVFEEDLCTINYYSSYTRRGPTFITASIIATWPQQLVELDISETDKQLLLDAAIDFVARHSAP